MSNDCTQINLSKVRKVTFNYECREMYLKLSDGTTALLKYDSLEEVLQFLKDLKDYHTYVVVRTQLVLLMIAAGVCTIIGLFS